MNRLGEETSPYLRQHRDNPVDWYPWGEEAFALACSTDRPLFVSIGYAACHWCHVMAHESFEDEAIAAILNEGFVSIKVDREERPDIDAIYLEAVQALTGSGGWPLSVFLDHEAKPFFGGTYFPPRDAHGLPSFGHLLDAIQTAWRERRPALLEQSEEITRAIDDRLVPHRHSARQFSLDSVDALFEQAIEAYASRFDRENGGLGGAPKFPQPPMLELLCEAAGDGDDVARQMLELTLWSMASGGIYDHLGGGFARYSVDRAWQVPHFEKMLYDQAGLARVYVHAFQLTGEPRWREVVTEILDYVLRDLRGPAGGVSSSEDADSEGHEGLFYIWSPEQLRGVLGGAADAAIDFYQVSEEGNFEGRSILHRIDHLNERPVEIEAACGQLFLARENRVRPGLDDKAITEWNAMIAGVLAEAGAALSIPRYVEAALQIGEFLHSELVDANGRVLRSWQAGRARHLGTAADYAWLVDCYTRLVEASGNDSWTVRAQGVAASLIELFSAEDGGWYLTGSDAPGLIVRPQDSHDGVVPAAGSIATSAIFRLGALVSDASLIERAEAGVTSRAVLLESAPLSVSHLLVTARRLAHGSVEIVISGDRPDLVSLVQSRYLPGWVLAWGEHRDIELWQGREAEGVYICRRGVCELPVHEPAELLAALTALTTR